MTEHVPTQTGETIAGYTFGALESARSPVTDEDLHRLQETVGWTDADAAVLRKHANLFLEQAEHMVDSWRAVIGAQPHLAQLFVGPGGKPDHEYKSRVKKRFVQWVVDVALRVHDRAWLNYQEEIGLRHTPSKKNATDGAQTPPLVPLRYLMGFVPVVLPIRKFFENALQNEADLSRLEAAWMKSVLLHVVLWSRPYTVGDLW